MILALLGACTPPGTLESVSEALATEAVTASSTPIRTATAIAAVMAETCGLASVEDHRFQSRSAAALGVGSAEVTREETSQTWIFREVGLDRGTGTLTVVTDANQQNFAITYSAEGIGFTAGFELRACDDGVPAAVIGGTGTWTSPTETLSLTLAGAAPTNGLAFDPTTAEVPTGGQMRVEDEAAGWVILMDEANTLAMGAPKWTGDATGSGWEHEVAIPWP